MSHLRRIIIFPEGGMPEQEPETLSIRAIATAHGLNDVGQIALRVRLAGREIIRADGFVCFAAADVQEALQALTDRGQPIRTVQYMQIRRRQRCPMCGVPVISDVLVHCPDCQRLRLLAA